VTMNLSSPRGRFPRSIPVPGVTRRRSRRRHTPPTALAGIVAVGVDVAAAAVVTLVLMLRGHHAHRGTQPAPEAEATSAATHPGNVFFTDILHPKI
jgi:hypothetical protein